mmetsp:Transcript_52226/g.124521  ORF Transcript_52226/g.124521 Transcript_52226/m.124521 type:complete len:148 (+) Transcript_52226:66-509(+)
MGQTMCCCSGDRGDSNDGVSPPRVVGEFSEGHVGNGDAWDIQNRLRGDEAELPGVSTTSPRLLLETRKAPNKSPPASPQSPNPTRSVEENKEEKLVALVAALNVMKEGDGQKPDAKKEAMVHKDVELDRKLLAQEVQRMLQSPMPSR